MRKINITIEIEDTDAMEYALEKELREMLGESIVSYTKLLNDSQLHKDDHHYRMICTKLKAAKRTKYEYFNKKRDDIK